jgi:hypothetical protein
MKFKQYLRIISDEHGFIPTPRFQWVIRKNERNTAREEAVVAEIQRQANPRENITGRFPWGDEEQMVLQQLWVHPEAETAAFPAAHHEYAVWRDVPIRGAEELYTVEQTEHGDMPVPNAVREPEQVQGDFDARLKELLGEEPYDER